MIKLFEDKSISKEKQFQIIQKINPAQDNIHTWIRSVSDIKTFSETLDDPDYEGWEENGFDPSYSANMAYEALKSNWIQVFSSYPINVGTFVTPSRMEAKSYSGSGKIWDKKVQISDIAWIDPTQGMYVGDLK